MQFKLSKKQWEFIGKQAGWKDEENTTKINIPDENELFEEVGVRYSFKQIDPLQKNFKYTLIHLPSDKKFEREIWCDNNTDFLKLINRWNSQKDWKATTAQ